MESRIYGLAEHFGRSENVPVSHIEQNAHEDGLTPTDSHSPQTRAPLEQAIRGIDSTADTMLAECRSKGINSDVHLSKIHIEWNKFYKQFDSNGTVPTRQQILDKATEIDKLCGSQFTPPIGE